MMTQVPASGTEGVAYAAPDRPSPPLRRRSPALRKAFPYLLVAPALAYLLARRYAARISKQVA